MTSARVLELQNSDLGLRPTDLSWHFPILLAIREEPFKNYCSTTSEKWKAREDKAEEFKKQKMQKNDDGRSLVSCFAVSDCHSPFSIICKALCSDSCWLKANQSVSTHEMSVVCFVTEKRSHWDYPWNHHLPDLLSETIQEKRKNHHNLWYLVWCLLYPVTYGLHRENMVTTTPFE